ncbi:nicotinate phosphoribosyltransferase [Moorella thermoacetica]|uniref:nicotinate phosphoribosyltransferase n=2 Tax=Neomoorella thermoacetica TaxID=1525 RepID=A0A1J5JIS2_NEOTH|nr:nicotinate phosphoribosyltransferase [Moorella thermoacetica]AKX94650.1 nicotinate phosphoribosyltransferase pncB2 [Moorella thermoacetica]AKX97283.1 nicotinate phosphoribosyltransferase pncB2 [Moorella thermoacetica]OIQ09442.1 nicotinate phosphoribosyltransferase pncB2 [Moorella thermoacetica]OIQ12430.1 nicotinate phosphoribosyltransferase pncB2 [Moorella thermoacetica]OIQ57298.1 nicotinate phosphoribosyltransferase pncB2 [Moorella thermoacetica]
MGTEVITSLEQVQQLEVKPDRRFYSAEHGEIASGATTDIYFVRTYEILKSLGKVDTVVTAEIFPRRAGILCGVNEVLELLRDKKVTVYGLPEGSPFEPKEVVMRIQGPYSEFGLFETTLLGMLASSSGWATAAREIREAAGEHPFVCFGARHVHPAVAPVMERAAIVGGADGASCILAAKLAGREPQGTVPHAVFLIIGDTVEGALAYDRLMPPDAKRTILIDTFKDEAEEALRVASALGPALAGVRLDTPSERGGVTPELVREVRYRLDMAGFNHVGIFVSGGLTPERIRTLIEAGADAFGVGSYISGAAPIDMTMDLKEVDGRPVAKRGRLPGIIPNPRLVQLK